jgi:hypothetical protein
MKYTDLNKDDLRYGSKEGDTTHYGNDFFRKFLHQEFADDYDIGKSSVFRCKEDIDRDTVRIINEMKAYDVDENTDRDSDKYTEKMKYFEDMIKNSSRTGFNYDFKGMQQ